MKDGGTANERENLSSIESGLVPKFAGCVDGANWFKSNGKWQDRTYEPKVGDIIFFDWEGDGTTDHVGIVEKCENGTVYEEYILSRIMEIIAAEPGFDHIVSSHPCNTLVFPGLELRLKERTVHRNGELISMTHREFATLVYLANHPSWVFSAGQIYEEVWGEDGENCGTAVASVIGQIRRKLTPDMPKAGYIRTVLGSGYKFEVPQGMAE